MARGKHEEHNPNRRVDWDSLFNQAVVQPLRARSPQSAEKCSGASCGADATTESQLTSVPMCQNCAEAELHADRNQR